MKNLLNKNSHLYFLVTQRSICDYFFFVEKMIEKCVNEQKETKDFILILCLSIIWHWGYTGENASKRNTIKVHTKNFFLLNENIEFCTHNIVKSTCDSILNV